MGLPPFPVITCPSCQQDTLVGRELGARDEWLYTCTKCSTPLSTADLNNVRSYDPDGLTMIGYKMGEDAGCGGSCGCG